MSLTMTLAGFASGIDRREIPDEVMARALALVTDFTGSILRAAHEADSNPAVLAMLERLGMDGDGPCTVFGLNRRYAAAAAALLNGTFGHSLDFDDTHADSSLHPSAPVVPAALAAAELTGASGADFLAAVVIGFEVCCRLGMALDPTEHYARGFHPTATAGTFGAAVAAGRLLGLNAKAMSSALGVAASQASGSLQFLVNGAWNKRYQVGEASMKGLMAATLAASDFVGAEDAIDGKHGFLGGYSDGADPARAVAGLGTVWETLRIGVKPYPACRYTHAAVDGLLALSRDLNLAPDEVEAITVGLHRNGITLVGAPLAEKRRARSVVEGQFSMPFAAAAALLRGRFGWDDYDLLGKPEAEALAARVDVVRDESLENLRHPFGATLTLRARNTDYCLRILDPSGEPETFPNAQAIAAKFRTLAGPVLNADADTLLSRLHDLPQALSLRGWFS
ncbi:MULTISPECIES: MmgE/PrpD family protein [Rhizobium/Agrobacterium group]|uniref:MmgE/PrpD family protein n=1 Tax=Rhizobium/Agrobacterium group TaxID=227290 RepID=UPI000712B041|nr:MULTISPECIES: MmgE/PrpD family protein [Rhizobium/Agrobacterium group]KRA64329.1 2-methylcitrate dehydratase [Rhizobium sp. Root651]MDH1270420.1 MmgE/PrpD family protein [Agrobacterium pusense]